MTRPSAGARQYPTHRQLLARTSAKPSPGSLDAIIVPASRSAVNLDHAVTLARALRCQLVVLCSHNARAAEVNELLALRNFTQAVVIDLPAGYTHPKLDFTTSKLVGLDLPGRVNPNVDLSTKRNLGLLLARMLGWERIFFMDDDIRDLDSSHLQDAASMLGPLRAVGMRAVDFPDNSVVCHGHRETGAYQDVFISGSVLAVHCVEPVAFFPEIYNEDWFFFYHAAKARKLGWSGRDATQLCYDPFADPRRAAGQEFGDVMAEGLYSLLHYQVGAEHASSDYWQVFLDSRKSFLEAVLARAETVEPYLRNRIESSIETALACSRQIKPSMCEQYIAFWRQDLKSWEQRLTELCRPSSVKAALSELDLVPRPSPYVLAGIIRKSEDGVSKDVAAGAAAPIPWTLGLEAAQRIEGLGAFQGVTAMASAASSLSYVGNLLQAGPGRSLERCHRPRAQACWELIRRAMVAEERSQSVTASPNREGARLAAGRTETAGAISFCAIE